MQKCYMWGEHKQVLYWLVLHRQHNSYAQSTACLQRIYMHNKENLRFIQIRAPIPISPCASLNFLAYARLSLPHIQPILSIAVACLILRWFWQNMNQNAVHMKSSHNYIHVHSFLVNFLQSQCKKLYLWSLQQL